MSLLELERVTKRYGPGAPERSVLREVCFELSAGELVAVWGMRRSGRSTLLRVAAGVTPPDGGVVRFDGRELRGRAADASRGAIGYCHTARRPAEAGVVLEQLVTDQLARGIGMGEAGASARAALARVGAEDCAPMRSRELDAAEAVRVLIARALQHRPKLLVVDEPTLGVDPLARDEILAILRSLADQDGIAILISTGETPCLSYADRALSLRDGALHGSLQPRLAAVLPLRRPA